MKFNISERLNLLPVCKGYSFDLTSNKVMADFANDLGFSQEELDKLKFNKNATDWDKTEDRFKEIKVGNKVKEVIQNELQKLDKKDKLSFLKHFNLCEKFNYEPKKKQKKRQTKK